MPGAEAPGGASGSFAGESVKHNGPDPSAGSRAPLGSPLRRYCRMSHRLARDKSSGLRTPVTHPAQPRRGVVLSVLGFIPGRSGATIPIHSQLTTSSNHLKFVQATDRREGCVRFGLVPEGSGGDIVLQGEVAHLVFQFRAPAERLNGDAQILGEADRIHDVPAIEPEALLGAIEPVRLDRLRHAGKWR